VARVCLASRLIRHQTAIVEQGEAGQFGLHEMAAGDSAARSSLCSMQKGFSLPKLTCAEAVGENT